MAKSIEVTVTSRYIVTLEKLSNDTLWEKFLGIDTEDRLYKEENEDLRIELEELAQQGDHEVEFEVD